MAERVLPSGVVVSDAEEAGMLAALDAMMLAGRGAQKTFQVAGDWYAVQAKPRGELMAAVSLKRLGLVVCHLRYRAIVSHARRKIVVERPLLPRYLFARLVAEAFPAVEAAAGVSGLVRAPGRPPLRIPEAVIDELRARADANGLVPAEVARKTFAAGERVRITAGPFEHFLAVIERMEGEAVRAWIDLFGRKTAVRVEAGAVEAVGKRRVRIG